MLFQIDTTALEEVLIPAEEPVQESINLFEMAQYGGWLCLCEGCKGVYRVII